MQPSYVPVPTIIVSDGDLCAQNIVARSCKEMGLYYLRFCDNAGNTPPGRQVIDLIVQAPKQPVVVLVDDKGFKGMGPGEIIIRHLLACHCQVKVLGVVAVASHTNVKGIKVDYSVTAQGEVLFGRAVDKDGYPQRDYRLKGDTVELLNNFGVPVVIGCGDIGKSGGAFMDEAQGVNIIKKCFSLILEKSKIYFVGDKTW